jgi:membrane protein YqaA with SNARE-associated domain
VSTIAAYAGLFASAFLAATLFPAQSEAVFVALSLNGFPVVALVVVASVANSLGSMVNWWLGRQLEQYRARSWFPVSTSALDRAAAWYRRFGRWSLLASWVPFIGDPLTFTAGVLREPFWSFVLLVTIAKTGRYLVLAALVSA